MMPPPPAPSQRHSLYYLISLLRVFLFSEAIWGIIHFARACPCAVCSSAHPPIPLNAPQPRLLTHYALPPSATHQALIERLLVLVPGVS
ncbi:hypothetical protein HD806DRAFT_480512 [Xylariaceae sp. AK1471]|nr:hypothetical protein HD806DRAFT_480512 [Xylariaceae sp. AK1471]